MACFMKFKEGFFVHCIHLKDKKKADIDNYIGLEG